MIPVTILSSICIHAWLNMPNLTMVRMNAVVDEPELQELSKTKPSKL